MKITTIMNIEVSALCNSKCEYCPAPVQGQWREVGLMTMDTFQKALEWVTYLSRAGSQLELNLFGIGEPTLNPDLIDMIASARFKLSASKPIHINTNGITMTRELAVRLKNAGLNECDLTGHHPKATAKAIRILRSVGIPGNLSLDFMTMPNNWAGQVDWFEPDYSSPCPWLHRGQAMVMWDGRVTTCCMDAKGAGVIGTVWDDLEGLEVQPYSLCSNCHHTYNPNIAVSGGDNVVLQR